jgi:hypothetical protein
MQIVDCRLFPKHQRAKLPEHGDHYVKLVDGQNLVHATGEPPRPANPLALGAVAVAAGSIEDLGETAAGLALIHVAAQLRRPAADDVTHHFALIASNYPPSAIVMAVLAQDAGQISTLKIPQFFSAGSPIRRI